MRLTNVRRSSELALGLAVAISLAGCDKKGGPAGAGNPTTLAPVSASQTPREAAELLLVNLSIGVLTPDHLTPQFFDEVPQPASIAARSAESKQAAVRNFLAQFRNVKFVLGEAEVQFGNAVVFRGRAESPDRREAFTLRLLRDGGEFKIDWLHRSDRFGTEIKVPTDPDLAAAQDTVRNFLDVLLGGDLRQAHALMSPDWKKRIAPPTPADIRLGDDYDPGFLNQTTRFWKRDFTGYSLPKTDLAANKASATFTAVFQAGAETVPHTVQAVKDPETGRWQVRDFAKN
jgi:hypothetical protein